MSDVTQTVYKAINEVCGIAETDLDTTATLVDAGIDSLDMVEIAMIVEEAFNLQIDTADFAECTTLGDTLNVFEQLVARR